MFSNYPGSSPCSYPGDTSFLQRAAAQDLPSLSVPSGSSTHNRFPSSGSEATQNDDAITIGGSHSRAGNSNRASIGSGSLGRHTARKLHRGSVYSLGGTRLSPTAEVDSTAGSDTEDATSEEPYSRDSSVGGRANMDIWKRGSEGAPIIPAAYSADAAQALVLPSESTPLLSSHNGNGNFGDTDDGEDDAKIALDPANYAPDSYTAAIAELKILLRYTLPICGTHFLEYSLLVVTVVSVGHIGTVELAAASLASMTSNVVALSVIQGFCTALDTLCPQAYTSRPKDTSLHALRTFFLLLLLTIPQVIIFWNSEWLLLQLRQDPRVARRSAEYLKVLSIGLPGYAGFECMRRWLQAQGLMLAPVITLVVAAPMNVILNYLLVWGPDSIRLGFIGAPLATAVSMNCMFLVSVLYGFYFAPRDAWGGFSWAIVHNLGLNIKLGLAGTAMVASEWWCWEIVGLASSFLGPTSLAAQSVLLTSASLFYQIPYALSVAAAVRCGNLLGAQRPALARTTSRVVLAIAVIIAGFNSLLLVVFRHVWGRMFSSEEDVIAIVAGVLPLVALFQLTDGLSGATGGLLRGAGKAPLGAIINLTSYYVIGLPIGIALAFAGPKLGLQGLWWGLTAALTWTAILTSTVVWRMNWEEESEKARIRMGVVKRDPEL